MADFPRGPDPRPTQTMDPDSFSAAIQQLVDFFPVFGEAADRLLPELAAMVSSQVYNPLTIYNQLDFAVPSFVYGSNGLTYVCAGVDVLGEDPVISETGNWTQIILTLEEIVNVLLPYLDDGRPTVKDPQYLTWNVGEESVLGPGRRVTDAWGLDLLRLDALSGLTSWANIANAGAVAQLTANNTYIELVDIIGSGVVTNLFLPGVFAAGDTVSVRVTVDGKEFVVNFQAENATDRFTSGMIKALHGQYDSGAGYRGFYGGSWTGINKVGGLAMRHDPGVHSIVFRPEVSMAETLSLRFRISVKIEMKASVFSAVNCRDYCGATYIIDQS